MILSMFNLDNLSNNKELAIIILAYIFQGKFAKLIKLDFSPDQFCSNSEENNEVCACLIIFNFYICVCTYTLIQIVIILLIRKMLYFKC